MRQVLIILFVCVAKVLREKTRSGNHRQSSHQLSKCYMAHGLQFYNVFTGLLGFPVCRVCCCKLDRDTETSTENKEEH